MTAAIDSFTYGSRVVRDYVAQMNRTSILAGQALDGSGPKIKAYPKQLGSTSTTILPAALGGSNLIFSDVITVPLSSTYVFDLMSFTDVMGRTAQTFVRVKSFYAILLSVAQDANVGTACTGVVMGNSGSNGHKLWMGAVANTHAFTNGSELFVDNPTAAGWATIDSTHKDILFTNSDSVAGKIYLEIVGGQA